MSGFGLAVTLLSRVPMPGRRPGPVRLSRAVPWFPVVGALVGATIAGVYAAASLVLPSLVAATIAIGFGVLLTGAFHEDGLGDTADGLAGGWTREERLRIMRDPRLGTYGVVAVTISLLLRTSALSTLGAWDAASALVAAHVLGRAAAIGLLGALPPVSADGLGATYAGAATRRGIAGGLVVGAVLGFAALGTVFGYAILVASGGVGLLALMARRRIGGITGDVLGAAEQIAEVLVLLVAAAVVSSGWASLAWWR